MESLLSLLRMHWDHEPTPDPSQEGNGQDADGCLLPSWEGSGVGRFMERVLDVTCSVSYGFLGNALDDRTFYGWWCCAHCHPHTAALPFCRTAGCPTPQPLHNSSRPQNIPSRPCLRHRRG